MKFDKDTLNSILDGVNQSITLKMVPETQENGTVESDPVIQSVSMSPVDTGITTSFDVAKEEVYITGAYRSQFLQVIRWKRGQLVRDVSGDPVLDSSGSYIEDPLQDPITNESDNWGDVPPSAYEANYDRDLLWYLYEFLPPEDTSTKTVTYTVTGTMTIQKHPEPPIPMPDPEVGVPFSVSITQNVSYDITSNLRQFKRYYPRDAGPPPYDDFWPPGSRPLSPGFPYILPMTLGS